MLTTPATSLGGFNEAARDVGGLMTSGRVCVAEECREHKQIKVN